MLFRSVKGTKSARWAEITSLQRACVRVEGSPYIRMEGRNLRVLPSVVGRSEKNRRPEAPEYRLDTGATAVFQGAFFVSLIAGEKKRTAGTGLPPCDSVLPPPAAVP